MTINLQQKAMYPAPNSPQKSVLLHIITSLSMGGAQRMLYSLLSQTNRERFEPIVVSLIDRGKYADRIEALGIPVYTIGMAAGVPTPNSLWQLVRLLRQLKPDAIQGWMYHANIAAQLASILSLSRIPVFWGIHHSIASLQSEKSSTIKIIKFGSYLSRLTAKIAFVSQASRQQHEALGYYRKNSCVIPNGFDTALFVPSKEAKLSVRSELRLPENAMIIGLICRYHPMKDHANFLQAAALLLNKHPDVHFLLAGTEVDTNNPDLMQLIKELAISNNVHLLGERSDMPRLIAALDINTLSSAYGEAFPLVVGEAMSCGVPCVVTDVGDSAWIVGNMGRVVPPKNSEALAQAWQDIIELSSAEKEALEKAARRRIIESFSLDLIVGQYEELYETVLTKKTQTET